MKPLPPDRSHIETEKPNPRSTGLHTASVTEIVQLINEEDAGIAGAVSAVGPAIAGLIEAAEPGFVAGGRLIYVGAGTSGRLGVLDASEAPPTFCVAPGRVVGIIAGGAQALVTSSESLEDDADGAGPELGSLALNNRDCVIGIAAGGTTPFALGSLAIAKQLAPGIVTGLICCTSIAKPPACDHLVCIPTGPEIITGSTRMKAGTATKMVLNTISTTLMIREGRVYGNLMVDLRATNAKLRDRAARILSQVTGLDRLAAFTALDASGGETKTAIVMHRLSCSVETARSALAQHHGRLDAVLKEMSSDE